MAEPKLERTKEQIEIALQTIITILELEKLTNRDHVTKLITDGLFLGLRHDSTGEEVFIPYLFVSPPEEVITSAPYWIIEAFIKEYK